MASPSGQSLHHKDSQATLISLLQLDPSPIDTPSPSTSEKRIVFPPDESNMVEVSDSGSVLSGTTAGTASAPGLNSHGRRSTMYYLTCLQKYSSYAMGIFTTLHLTNVSLIPAIARTVPSSETYLLMTREIYQTTLTEPLLVFLPVVTHVGSGIALRLLRRWQNMKRYGGGTPGMYALHQMRDALSGKPVSSSVRLWPPLSYISASGYAFTFCYGAHVFMNRILPLLVEGDSSNVGLAYVAHGFARHPATSYVAYLGLLAAASGHMVWGMAKWLGVAPSTKGWMGKESVVVDVKTKRTRRRKWLGVQGAAVGVAALWAVGGLGIVARGGLTDGWVGKVYDGLFGSVGL
ncbi:hypothetical protein QQS21_008747 [Conoideocrella luteorostrata]|uniref:Mitochondrial adapter protein MCP1 transmembrane domain-containing protein n=1 Tax=Conoideocrella luteorostrata TaxID=1105319 RepID=A0AAJ0CL20_9HYPO|nr:hypothetical protein QQS21_008747 [Conoideocrella luteorostrata]